MYVAMDCFAIPRVHARDTLHRILHMHRLKLQRFAILCASNGRNIFPHWGIEAACLQKTIHGVSSASPGFVYLGEVILIFSWSRHFRLTGPMWVQIEYIFTADVSNVILLFGWQPLQDVTWHCQQFWGQRHQWTVDRTSKLCVHLCDMLFWLCNHFRCGCSIFGEGFSDFHLLKLQWFIYSNFGEGLCDLSVVCTVLPVLTKWRKLVLQWRQHHEGINYSNNLIFPCVVCGQHTPIIFLLWLECRENQTLVLFYLNSKLTHTYVLLSVFSPAGLRRRGCMRARWHVLLQRLSQHGPWWYMRGRRQPDLSKLRIPWSVCKSLKRLREWIQWCALITRLLVSATVRRVITVCMGEVSRKISCCTVNTKSNCTVQNVGCSIVHKLNSWCSLLFIQISKRWCLSRVALGLC